MFLLIKSFLFKLQVYRPVTNFSNAHEPLLIPAPDFSEDLQPEHRPFSRACGYKQCTAGT
jgi:hypothetical protein